MKNAIIDHAAELGENRDQVGAFIDKVFQIPPSVPAKIEADPARAISTIESFIADYNGRTIHLNVCATGPSGATIVGNPSVGYKAPGQALGGTVRGLAGGGSGGTAHGPGPATSDTAGVFRLARGEEVVSNIFGQAGRNRALLKQINAGFTPGPTVVTVPAAPEGTPALVVNVTFNIT